MRNHRIRRTAQPDQAGQRAGVDARQPDAAIGLHPHIKMLCAAEIGRIGHILPRDAADGMGVDRLHILNIAANIADMRKGEVDDLLGIGRVRHHLLITGHRGVETDFANRRALCAKAFAP